MIWEVALREGYSLTSRVEKLEKTGENTFWRVTDSDRDQFFYICLDASLTLAAVAPLKLTGRFCLSAATRRWMTRWRRISCCNAA